MSRLGFCQWSSHLILSCTSLAALGARRARLSSRRARLLRSAGSYSRCCSRCCSRALCWRVPPQARAEERFCVLQNELVCAAMCSRSQNVPDTWAFEFRGYPRCFFFTVPRNMPVTCSRRTHKYKMVNGQIHDHNAHAHADICVQKKKGHPASLARKQASHASRGEETSSSELVATRLACRYTFSCHTRGVRPLLRVMFEAGLHLFGQVDLPLPEAHLVSSKL